MEAMDSAVACMLAGAATYMPVGCEGLERPLRRSARERLFRSVVADIEHATLHFNTGLIDEGTLLGVLRDRLAALEQLAQVEFPS